MYEMIYFLIQGKASNIKRRYMLLDIQYRGSPAHERDHFRKGIITLGLRLNSQIFRLQFSMETLYSCKAFDSKYRRKHIPLCSINGYHTYNL